MVASVKRDVVDATLRWRSSLGDVQILEPGLSKGLTWDPLEDVTSFRRGIEVARNLTLAPSSHSSGETEFWNTMAVKLLGALFTLTKARGGSIYDVVQTLESRSFFSTPDAPDEVMRALDAFGAHEGRTRDAVSTTAEAMLLPWHFSRKCTASWREPTRSISVRRATISVTTKVFLEAHWVLYSKSNSDVLNSARGVACSWCLTKLPPFHPSTTLINWRPPSAE